MAKLTTKARKKLPASAFAIPPDRYPIHDIAHARNALARVAANGTPEEKRKVARAVARRYGIGPAAKKARVTELANGKPPYQWKHGWIPLTPDAKLIKTKKKRGSAKDRPPAVVGTRSRISASDVQARNWDRLDAFRQGRQGKQEYTDRQALLAEYKQRQDRQASQVKLTPDEREAIDDYVYDSTEINNAMRGLGKPTPETKKAAEHVVAAIQRSRLDQDTVLYRGTDGRLLDQLRVGDVFVDKAPSSTSYDPVISLEFAEGLDYVEGRKPAMLVIEAPKGTRGLMLDNLNHWQRETLLAPEQPLEVLSIEDGVIRVRAT